MPKCQIKGCSKNTRNQKTIEKFCPMHRERIKRHGYPELKSERGEHGLEKLPHSIDNFIIENCKNMIDREILEELKQMGFSQITADNVKYRRRKLGVKKYLYGDVKKHKAWIRAQAIKKYGGACELCGYNIAIDTHYIVPKYQGGPHEIDNLTVICPNCHALITRGKLVLSKREDIPKIRKEVLVKLKKFYSFL